MDKPELNYAFSPLRKRLLTVFLLGSVVVVAGQFMFARGNDLWLPAALEGAVSGMGTGGTVAESQPPAAGPSSDESAIGVAEASEGEREVAPGTRTLREIRIPSLGIRTGVQDLGLTADGRMGSPSNHYEVGWFKYGVMPGERGNAVIAGHVNTLRSPEGVFKDLHLLKVGDRVELTDKDGHSYVFIVTGSKKIPYDASTSDTADIFGPTIKRRLNLVTCSGSWIPEKKTYTERLIVFTELAE